MCLEFEDLNLHDYDYEYDYEYMIIGIDQNKHNPKSYAFILSFAHRRSSS